MCFFTCLDGQMPLSEYTGNNKTLKPTAATVRWTLSFYIVMNSLVLFDSLVLEDRCELEFVDDAT